MFIVELVERAITTKNIDIHIEFMEIQIKGRGGRPENSTFKRRKKDLWDIQTHLQFINEAQAMVDEENSNRSKFDLEMDFEWNNAKNMDVW